MKNIIKNINILISQIEPTRENEDHIMLIE